jgi:undecaprenyl-diphosphatase
MDSTSAIVLGLIQGLTEFLPVSSTGHLILAREFFGFSGDHGLAVDAFFHLLTAAAVLIYFRRDVMRLLHSVLRFPRAEKKDQRLIMALVLGTVPALVLGLLLSNAVDTFFRSPHLVAYALIAGSLIFVLAEILYKWYSARMHREGVLMRHGVWVGLFQALALVPGMSRSGMTISGAMLLGYTREEAARFAFLLSFPIILGAGLLKTKELFDGGVFDTGLMPLIAGGAAAFLSALFAIHIMMSFLKKRSLLWFAGYRIILAILVLLIL